MPKAQHDLNMFKLGSHPINLAVRFILEVAMLVALSIWGYRIAAEGQHIWWAVIFPILAMGLWVTFATRDDPSRSGKTVVQTPGTLRLALEWTLFCCAIWACYDLERPQLATIFLAVTALHYLLSLDRLVWLLRQR